MRSETKNEGEVTKKLVSKPDGYEDVLSVITLALESGRRASARAINTFIATTYWEIGRHIV
ncbi:MAG: hypothetical protein V3W41_03085 [Planctomycetota bacterium]